MALSAEGPALTIVQTELVQSPQRAACLSLVFAVRKLRHSARPGLATVPWFTRSGAEAFHVQQGTQGCIFTQHERRALIPQDRIRLIFHAKKLWSPGSLHGCSYMLLYWLQSAHVYWFHPRPRLLCLWEKRQLLCSDFKFSRCRGFFKKPPSLLSLSRVLLLGQETSFPAVC